MDNAAPPDQVQICDNCKREVSTTNFVMHTMHCQRNIVLCTKCDTPYPKSDIEGHMKTAHSKVTCAACGDVMEQHMIDSHLTDECPKRMVCCPFCEVEVPAADRDEHEDYCGSRTEPCPGCGQYVMVQFKDIHLSSDHSFFSLEDLNNPEQNAVNNVKEDSAVASLSRASSNNKRTNDMPQVNVSQNVEKAMTSKPSLQAVHEPRKMPSELSVEELDHLLALQVASEDAQAGSPPPMHPGKDFAMPAAGSLLSGIVQRVGATVNSLVSSTGSARDTGRVVPSTEEPEETLNLPCEFCGDLLPADVLIEHQSVCELGIGPHRNDTPPPPSNPLGLHGSGHSQSPFDRRPVTVDGALNDDGENLIPCEYCGESFNADLFMDHQADCANYVRREEPSVRPRVVPQHLQPPALPRLPPAAAHFTAPRRHLDSDDDDDEYLEDAMLHEAIENSLKRGVTIAASAAPVNRMHAGRGYGRDIVQFGRTPPPLVRHIPIEVVPGYCQTASSLRSIDSQEDVEKENALRQLRQLKSKYGGGGGGPPSVPSERLTEQADQAGRTFPRPDEDDYDGEPRNVQDQAYRHSNGFAPNYYRGNVQGPAAAISWDLLHRGPRRPT